MMSQNVYEYVKNLVIGKVDKYEYYICYTNSNNNYNSNIYDVTCAFSSDKPNLNSYHISVNNALLCDIDTNSYSYNSTNQLERLNCRTSNLNKTINNYETIYTNASDNFPSIISTLEYDKQNNLVYNLDLNYFGLVALFFSIFLCLLFLSKIFRLK